MREGGAREKDMRKRGEGGTRDKDMREERGEVIRERKKL